MNIKTVSFDMWNTLIKGNPEFRVKRAEYVSKYSDLSIDEINQVFVDVKKDADSSVEKFGIQFSTISLYEKIVVKTNYTKSAKTLMMMCEALFIEYPPILIKDTLEILNKLKDQKYELILSSNTLLIDHNIIEMYLSSINVLHFFKRTVFSSKIKVSKPNPLFYKQVQEVSNSLKSEIVHVGDNLTTDIVGASDYGFHTYHINKLYNQTLTTFFNILNK